MDTESARPLDVSEYEALITNKCNKVIGGLVRGGPYDPLQDIMRMAELAVMRNGLLDLEARDRESITWTAGNDIQELKKKAS